MTDTTASAPSVPDKDPVSRFLGVLLSPTETFQVVVARPTWLVVALIVILLSGGSQMWFQTTEVGRQATLDEAVRRTESFGLKLEGDAYEKVRQSIMEPPPWRVALSAVAVVAVPLVLWAALAGLLFLVFSAVGGQARFKQVFAVVVHSAAVSAVGALVMTPVNYFRESLSSATNLGVFLPFLDEGSFLARLAGMVDLFLVWWVIVLSIGLAVCFKRKTSRVAAGLFAVYALIAIGFAAFMAMRSSS
jgi:hypothetical protein